MFKRKILYTVLFIAAFLLMGCTYTEPKVTAKPVISAEKSIQSEVKEENKENTENKVNTESTNMIIKAGNKEFKAVLYNNETTSVLLEKLPLTVNMSDLNSNEKYYYFDEAFPKNSEKVGSINAGDIMLYGDSCVVLFYKNFNTSYSYTKIGYIENIEGLESALGNSDIDATFKIDEGENL